MKFIFMDTEKNTELVLPVTPPTFEVSHGIKIEIINIHSVGDVALPGYGTLSKVKIDCMFPAKRYPFNLSKSHIDPYSYVKKFETWCTNHTLLRFIISGTPVNLPTIISDIVYGERDGSGDVYATISLQEYRLLGNNSRSAEKPTTAVHNYVIKSGDTLSSICRKQYGDASLNKKLAVYNGIKNVNLIYAGKALMIPDKKLL